MHYLSFITVFVVFLTVINFSKGDTNNHRGEAKHGSLQSGTKTEERIKTIKLNQEKVWRGRAEAFEAKKGHHMVHKGRKFLKEKHKNHLHGARKHHAKRRKHKDNLRPPGPHRFNTTFPKLNISSVNVVPPEESGPDVVFPVLTESPNGTNDIFTDSTKAPSKNFTTRKKKRPTTPMPPTEPPKEPEEFSEITTAVESLMKKIKKIISDGLKNEIKKLKKHVISLIEGSFATWNPLGAAEIPEGTTEGTQEITITNTQENTTPNEELPPHESTDTTEPPEDEEDTTEPEEDTTESEEDTTEPGEDTTEPEEEPESSTPELKSTTTEEIKPSTSEANVGKSTKKHAKLPSPVKPLPLVPDEGNPANIGELISGIEPRKDEHS